MKLNWKKIGLAVGGTALVGFAAYEGAKMGCERFLDGAEVIVRTGEDEESSESEEKED